MWVARASGLLIPAYLATGAGKTGTGTSASFTDTIPTGAKCTVVWAHIVTSSAPTLTATVDGTSAPLQGSLIQTYTVGGNTGRLACFALLSSPIGSSKTILLSSNVAMSYCAVDTVHYKGVRLLGTPITLSNQATAVSMAVPSSLPSVLYANAIGYGGNGIGDSFSAYSQTQRKVFAADAATSQPTVIGDGLGNGGALTFSATRSSTAFNWGGIILPLIP